MTSAAISSDCVLRRQTWALICSLLASILACAHRCAGRADPFKVESGGCVRERRETGCGPGRPHLRGTLPANGGGGLEGGGQVAPPGLVGGAGCTPTGS